MKNNPIDFGVQKYKTQINSELEKNNILNAFLLVCSYLEAYISEWFFIMGIDKKKDFGKDIIKSFDRISFSNLILIHLIIGNINFILYKKLSGFNQSRNEIVHQLATIDIHDKKTIDEIRKKTEAGIKMCDEVYELYKKAIQRRGKQIDENGNFIKSENYFEKALGLVDEEYYKKALGV